jgi:hypothetical protein
MTPVVTHLANLPEGFCSIVPGREYDHRSWEAQQQDAGRILSEAAATWWRIEVSPEDASLLRGLSTDRYPTSRAGIRRLIALIPNLLRAFSTDAAHSAGDLELVRRDASIRLWLLTALSLKHSPGSALPAAARAISISPLSAWFFGLKAARRIGRP